MPVCGISSEDEDTDRRMGEDMDIEDGKMESKVTSRRLEAGRRKHVKNPFSSYSPNLLLNPTETFI